MIGSREALSKAHLYRLPLLPTNLIGRDQELIELNAADDQMYLVNAQSVA